MSTLADLRLAVVTAAAEAITAPTGIARLNAHAAWKRAVVEYLKVRGPHRGDRVSIFAGFGDVVARDGDHVLVRLPASSVDVGIYAAAVAAADELEEGTTLPATLEDALAELLDERSLEDDEAGWSPVVAAWLRPETSEVPDDQDRGVGLLAEGRPPCVP